MPPWGTVGWGWDGWNWAPPVLGAAPWLLTALGSSLVGLWDAQTIPTSTTTLSSWTDSSGANLTASGTVGYSATARNGKPGVTFSGSQSMQIGGIGAFPSGSAASTMIVGTYCSAAASNMYIFGWGNNGTNANRTIIKLGSSQNVYFACQGNDQSASETWSGVDRCVIVQTPAGASPTNVINVDGAAAETTTLSTLSTVLVQAALGGYIGSGGGFLTGVIQVAAVVNRVLTTGERQKAEGWESWHNGKNGANLPVGHPCKSAAPTMSAEDVERLLDEGMYFRDARYRRELGLTPVAVPLRRWIAGHANDNYCRRASGLVVPEYLAA